MIDVKLDIETAEEICVEVLKKSFQGLLSLIQKSKMNAIEGYNMDEGIKDNLHLLFCHEQLLKYYMVASEGEVFIKKEKAKWGM